MEMRGENARRKYEEAGKEKGGQPRVRSQNGASVRNALDLVDAVRDGEGVEAPEEAAEQRHALGGGERARQPGVANHIREDARHMRMVLHTQENWKCCEI